MACARRNSKTKDKGIFYMKKEKFGKKNENTTMNPRGKSF